MRAEPPPTGDHPAEFRAIWEDKQPSRRNRLEKAEAAVLDRYSDFVLAADKLELEQLPWLKWTAAAKDALRHCYDGRTKALSALKKSFVDGLSEEARLRCPYCMMRQPGSIDHFLPLDSHPEFAVLTLNWVYACETCNRRKGEGLASVQTRDGTVLVGIHRSILNPYFDRIPIDIPILYADVAIVGAAPIVAFFALCPNSELPDPTLAEIAERQMAELDLAGKMRDEGANLLSSTIGTIVAEASGALSQDELTDRLQARRRNVGRFGINGWELALIEAAEACPDLLAHVNGLIATKPPPAPLPPPRNSRLRQRAAEAAASR